MSVNGPRREVSIRPRGPPWARRDSPPTERGRVVDHVIHVTADRLRERVGAESVAVGDGDAAQAMLAQQERAWLRPRPV